MHPTYIPYSMKDQLVSVREEFLQETQKLREDVGQRMVANKSVL